MSKRNLILIAIGVIILIILVLVLASFLKPSTTTTGNTEGTNFFSRIFPFGKSVDNNENNSTSETPSTTIVNEKGVTKERLVRISSMPVAGYGVYQKERYLEVPAIPATETPPTEVAPTENQPALETPAPINAEIKKPKKSTQKTNPVPVVKPTPPATEFVPAVRYVERATGNVYESLVDQINEVKLTTTTIPQTYEANFAGKSAFAVLRYLGDDAKTIEAFLGNMPPEILGGDTGASELSGSFLPENITDMSVSPDSSSIFYLFKNNTGVVGVTAQASGTNKNQIFSSPFTEWLSFWPNDRMITLTTKPSYAVPGYVYAIDPATKKMTRVMSGVNGLTTLASPSGKLVLYANNTLDLRIFNIDAQGSTTVGIKTLPEKCVWGLDSIYLYCAVPNYVSGANYPDTWYQGEISFSDQIWKVNTENGNTTLLADPAAFQAGEDMDGIKLSLDKSGKYLFFVNKKDSSLWELILN